MVSLCHNAELKAHASSSQSACGPDGRQPMHANSENTHSQVLLILKSAGILLAIQFFQRAGWNHRHRPVFMRARPHWHHGQCKWPLQSLCLGFTRETLCSLMRTNRAKILSLLHSENYADSEGLEPLPMTTVTYSLTCSRKDLSQLTEWHAQWNKMSLSEWEKQER